MAFSLQFFGYPNRHVGFTRQYEPMFGGKDDLPLLHEEPGESMRVSKQKRSCRLMYGQLVHESDVSAVQQQFSLYDVGVLECRDFSFIPAIGEKCYKLKFFTSVPKEDNHIWFPRSRLFRKLPEKRQVLLFSHQKSSSVLVSNSNFR